MAVFTIVDGMTPLSPHVCCTDRTDARTGGALPYCAGQKCTGVCVI